MVAITTGSLYSHSIQESCESLKNGCKINKIHPKNIFDHVAERRNVANRSVGEDFLVLLPDCMTKPHDDDGKR